MYALNFSLTTEQLEVFYATGSNIVVARPPEGAEPNVAWQVFRPFESNSLTWEEAYGIYASTTTIQNGAILNQMSRTEYPAVEGKNYVFSPSGAFGPPSTAQPLGSYYAANEYGSLPYVTMGLFADAVVNGTEVTGNAISAAGVLLGSQIALTPAKTAYAWVQAEVSSNTVVSRVTSPKTKVVFGGGVTQMSLAFDSQNGTFIPASGLPEGATVDTDIAAVL